MIFTTLAVLQVFQAIGTRSPTESLRTIGLTTNRFMVAIAAIVLSLQLAALYTPLHDFLDLDPLALGDLAICFGLGALLLAVLEATKAKTRRKVAPAAIDTRARPQPNPREGQR